MTAPGDDLYIPPPEGESTPISARVDRTIKRMIQKVVQSGKTRHETESDLVRSAVAHFLIDHGVQLQVFTSPEIAQLQKVTARRRDTARSWDFVKHCNVSKDALLKIYKVSPARAAEEYETYVTEIRDIDPVLAREYEQWAKREPALQKVRDAVDAMNEED